MRFRIINKRKTARWYAQSSYRGGLLLNIVLPVPGYEFGHDETVWKVRGGVSLNEHPTCQLGHSTSVIPSNSPKLYK